MRVGRIHDAALVGVIWRWRELTIRHAIEQPLVFERNVARQPKPGLRLRVRLVLEPVGGHRRENTLRRLHLVLEISNQECRDAFRLSGSHKLLLFVKTGVCQWG